MQTALVTGGLVAVVSGVVGTFTVARGQSFAGHALADTGSAGGSAAILFNLSPLYGFVALNVLAAGAMEAIGIRHARGRDIATGIVLGAALGLAALFLYLDTTTTSVTGASMYVLFGDIFILPASMVPGIAVLSVLSLGAVLLLYRPLLLVSLSPDLANSRGLPVRAVGVCYVTAMALAVSLSALTIGAILSTALLVGPAASALRLATRPGPALVWAAGIAVAATWLGVLLAWDSYYWLPDHASVPVSFFVVSLIFAFYVLVQASRPRLGYRLLVIGRRLSRGGGPFGSRREP